MFAGLFLITIVGLFLIAIACIVGAFGLLFYKIANYLWGKQQQEGYAAIFATGIACFFLFPGTITEATPFIHGLAGAALWLLLAGWAFYKSVLLRKKDGHS